MNETLNLKLQYLHHSGLHDTSPQAAKADVKRFSQWKAYLNEIWQSGNRWRDIYTCVLCFYNLLKLRLFSTYLTRQTCIQSNC